MLPPCPRYDRAIPNELLLLLLNRFSRAGQFEDYLYLVIRVFTPIVRESFHHRAVDPRISSCTTAVPPRLRAPLATLQVTVGHPSQIWLQCLAHSYPDLATAFATPPAASEAAMALPGAFAAIAQFGRGLRS
ncbi:hypothetical protein NL676_022829 [Syzygium grande]|nr:hypothetical protein NL676_022829 [Syzygium grande]